MEATSHGSELGRLDRVRFAVLVFTNLSQDHLDFHETMERYFEAKRRLFVESGPPAAINVGDAWGRKLAAGVGQGRQEPRPHRPARRRQRAQQVTRQSRCKNASSAAGEAPVSAEPVGRLARRCS